MNTKSSVKIPTEPMSLGELEDFLVYEMGLDRSSIIVNVEAITENQVKLHVPFEQH